ncbi:hypothetical protein A3K64_00230 [Candidatus Micrarchaeota archaeon RBG_16_36_9]|nr:MAG: hypothetical protein A3K64_00230 [Candidatus Micrarchaeota archaeon RBG_16_36_9]
MTLKEKLRKCALITAELALPIGTSLQINEELKSYETANDKKDKKSKIIYFAPRFGLMAKDIAQSVFYGQLLGQSPDLSMYANGMVQLLSLKIITDRRLPKY